MIHWLAQKLEELPEPARGDPPVGVLSEWEQSRWSTFPTAKRRQEWLLGRWTSKLLVEAVCLGQTGEQPALHELNIGSRPDGAPVVEWTLRRQPVPVTLSISHSGDRALCAAVGLRSPGLPPEGLIGADIETVETRPPGFVEEYFTETEIALVGRAPARSRDLLVTATWSAKEAALKALRLGLSVDTRSAICTLDVEVVGPGWAPFQIEWDVRRLNRCTDRWPRPPQLIGWWRVMDGYVLTLAANEAAPPREINLAPGGDG